MWSPIDLFFVMWHCNFAPCQDARLNTKDIIHFQENKVISQSVTLRNDF